MNKIIRTNRFFIQRCISTSNTNFKSTSREGRFMEKFLRNDRKHTKTWYNYTPGKPATFSVEKQGPSRVVERRMAILSKLFMEHISDLMSMGEIFPELLNRGIELTHVGVTPNFCYVRVYWFSNVFEPKYILETQELLNKSASVIRHKLTQLHVMSVVPKIQFVRSKEHSTMKEVDYLLSIADYGLDFKPTSIMPEQAETNEALPFPVPKMKNDVFGIDHTRIMNKIKATLNQSHNITTQYRLSSIPTDTSSSISKSSSVTKGIDNKECTLLLTEFLKQKIIERKKKYDRIKDMRKANEEELHAMNADENNKHYEDEYYDSDEFNDYNDDFDDDIHENDRDSYTDDYKDDCKDDHDY